MNRSNANEHRKTSVSSPEKEDRYYTTRGSVGVDDSNKLFIDSREEKKKMVWPKLLITLSSKEKEEDFMAMKGCKLPQRPKKRAKLIQRTVLVSPSMLRIQIYDPRIRLLSFRWDFTGWLLLILSMVNLV